MVCTLPLLRDTAGQCAGGTHPTGMHSCYICNYVRFHPWVKSSSQLTSLTIQRCGMSLSRGLFFQTFLTHVEHN